MNLNLITLAGRLTRDPELKYVGEHTICEFGLAVSKKLRNREETMFIDLVCWQRTAEVAAEYLRKGSPVLVRGRLTLDQWDDKETGKKRSKHRVTVEELQMVPKGQGGAQEPHRDQYQPAESVAVPSDEELPF